MKKCAKCKQFDNNYCWDCLAFRTARLEWLVKEIKVSLEDHLLHCNPDDWEGRTESLMSRIDRAEEDMEEGRGV